MRTTRHGGKHPTGPAQHQGRWPRRALSGVAASDPGLVRLHSASRTVIGLALALGVLPLVNTLAGQPLTVTIVGMVATMVGSIAINAPQPRERLITRAATIARTAAAATLGILLSPHLIAGISADRVLHCVAHSTEAGHLAAMSDWPAPQPHDVKAVVGQSNTVIDHQPRLLTH